MLHVSNLYARKAFTLAELLVSALIIGILASIVVIAVSRVADYTEFNRLSHHSRILNNSLNAYAEISLGNELSTTDANETLGLLVDQNLLGRAMKSLLGTPPTLDHLNNELGANSYVIIWDEALRAFIVKSVSDLKGTD